jgi:hypothetical protein
MCLGDFPVGTSNTPAWAALHPQAATARVSTRRVRSAWAQIHPMLSVPLQRRPHRLLTLDPLTGPIICNGGKLWCQRGSEQGQSSPQAFWVTVNYSFVLFYSMCVSESVAHKAFIIVSKAVSENQDVTVRTPKFLTVVEIKFILFGRCARGRSSFRPQ